MARTQFPCKIYCFFQSDVKELVRPLFLLLSVCPPPPLSFHLLGGNLSLHLPVSTNEKPPISALCKIVRISHLLTYLQSHLLFTYCTYCFMRSESMESPHLTQHRFQKPLILPTPSNFETRSGNLTSLDVYCTSNYKYIPYFYFPNRCKEAGYDLEMNHLSFFVRGKGAGGVGATWVVYRFDDIVGRQRKKGCKDGMTRLIASG